jgi:hypothetical protein
MATALFIFRRRHMRQQLLPNFLATLALSSAEVDISSTIEEDGIPGNEAWEKRANNRYSSDAGKLA